jgi:hypothetical protein
VGGTTIWGGLGVGPTEKLGRLFVWDPKRKKKVFETTDLEVPAVMALINGPDGNVWGIAGDSLFIFEVQSRRIVKRFKLFDAPRDPSQPRWRGPTLRVHPSGMVYGDLEGKLFRLDRSTMRATVLREKDASLTVIDRAGNVYFRDRINLWQYVP